jgi:hypothetical protein
VRANAHREGLKTALDPLREHLDQMKAGFWVKNREILEARVRKYVKEKIKDRVLVEVTRSPPRSLVVLMMCACRSIKN